MSYFTHPFVSNSDLSALSDALKAPEVEREVTDAYRIGTLVDAMITEPYTADSIRRAVGPYRYTPEEWQLARRMKDALMADALCSSLLANAECQKEIYREGVTFQRNGVEYSLNMRCKFDLFCARLGMGPDIKTTAATTLEQFRQAAIRFEYPRQRALYMKLGGFRKDLLIGISKSYPHTVFKLAIREGDELHRLGTRRLEELTYKFWALHGSEKPHAGDPMAIERYI